MVRQVPEVTARRTALPRRSRRCGRQARARGVHLPRRARKGSRFRRPSAPARPRAHDAVAPRGGRSRRCGARWSLRPDFAPLHEDLGGILAMQRRFEEAVASFRTALRLDPNLPLAHKKLGQALAALGRGAEADTAFEDLVRAGSRTAAQVAIALDHLRAGRKDEAIVDPAQGAAGQSRQRRRAAHARAGVLGRREAAVRHRGAAAPRDGARARRTSPPGPCSACCCMTPIARRTRSPATSGVVELEPGNAAAWSGLGADYAQIGDMEKSAEAYARSVALQPGLPGIHMSYAHVAEGARAAGRRRCASIVPPSR